MISIYREQTLYYSECDIEQETNGDIEDCLVALGEGALRTTRTNAF